MIGGCYETRSGYGPLCSDVVGESCQTNNQRAKRRKSAQHGRRWYSSAPARLCLILIVPAPPPPSSSTIALVDFGPGVVRRAKAAVLDKGLKVLEPANLKVAFVTHLHSDHTAGYPDLTLTGWTAGRRIPLEV
jgi:hypothetical protein